ncbi:MAG: hypothetical protein JSR46_03445, partial [Verrucomicrobia bacterium]|nr:hypothetical protein [Verrucomicrobiota bacterium]
MDVLKNPILLAEDAGVGAAGIWFIEYFVVPSGLWTMWPNKMSLAITEGALSVLLWNFATGRPSTSWIDLLVQALVGGV